MFCHDLSHQDSYFTLEIKSASMQNIVGGTASEPYHANDVNELSL